MCFERVASSAMKSQLLLVSNSRQKYHGNHGLVDPVSGSFLTVYYSVSVGSPGTGRCYCGIKIIVQKEQLNYIEKSITCTISRANIADDFHGQICYNRTNKRRFDFSLQALYKCR